MNILPLLEQCLGLMYSVRARQKGFAGPFANISGHDRHKHHRTLGADARIDIGDGGVSTTLIGQTQAMPIFTDDTLAGFIGLDADYALTGSTSLSLATEFSAGRESTSASASLQIRVMF